MPGYADLPVRPRLTVRARLAWPKSTPEAPVYEDRASIARTFAYLFGFGAMLLILTLALPGAGDRSELALALIGVVAAATSAAFVLAWDRPPLWVFKTAPLLGAGLVSLAVYFGGAASAPAYAMYYFWVVVSSAYFFSFRVSAMHVAFSMVCYGVVLHLLGAMPGELAWIMAAGTLTVAGLVMVVLRLQVQRLLVRLASAARTDSLTGLANRRPFDEAFARES